MTFQLTSISSTPETVDGRIVGNASQAQELLVSSAPPSADGYRVRSVERHGVNTP